MKFILLILTMLGLSACSDSCQEYSDFSCEEIEKAEYNVYFYFPSEEEVFLGSVNGLKTCGSLAWNYAAEKELSRNRDWSYICCMKANGSSCYEKHR